MRDVSDPLGWAERGEEDYLLARSALRRKKRLVCGACFHAQQCAEKYLKALLISKYVTFPKTHDLLVLNDLCENQGVFLGMAAKQLHTLSDYAVQVRYPGDEPTPDEAREAIGIAKAVRRFARTFRGIK